MICENLLGLSRLPWFGVKDGRLVRTDRDAGPVIDVHTHLALAYVRPLSVDLHRAWPDTLHYLPSCCSVDLDPYANKNFSAEQLRTLSRDLTIMSLGPGGMRRTHTVPNLRREMDELGIERSVILPIDFPLISDNAGAALAATEGDERFVCFGSVHPFSTGREKKLDFQHARGARGIKVHPAVQTVRPDARRAMDLYRWSADRDMTVLWHCGPVGIEPRLGRWLTQVRFYERPIAENPRTRFVLGHSGALQWEPAIELACKYPNVWLESSSQGVPALREIARRAPRDRILFGSDWPFYHQAIPLAKALIVTADDPELRRKWLYENARALLALES